MADISSVDFSLVRWLVVMGMISMGNDEDESMHALADENYKAEGAVLNLRRAPATPLGADLRAPHP